MKRLEIFFGLIRIPIDLALSITAFLMAYKARSLPYFSSILKSPDLGIFPPIDEFLKIAFFGALLLLVILGFFGLYALKITSSFSSEIRKIFLSVSIWLMAVITYYFLIREFPFSRLILLYGWFFAGLLLIIGRTFIHFIQKILLAWGIGQRNVVIVGEGELAKLLKTILENKKIYRVANIVESLMGVEAAMKRQAIDEVVQTKNLEGEPKSLLLDFCREHHLEYHFVPDVLEVSRSNVSVNTYDGIPLITLKKTPLDGWGKVLKRTFDIIVSLLLLLMLSPILMLMAIVIKLDSKGPIFFIKDDDGKRIFRVGQKGKKFYCWKFRTMKTGTHNLRYAAEFQKNNIRKGTPLVKIENDPRVTAAGKFLRKYSLDELPQFWNVLLGDMSLVGPRPHLAEEVTHYEGHHKFVHTIKPGITGLAQVSGRSDLPFEEEVRLDTFYIEHWSLWLDLKILLKTLFVIFRGYRE